MKKAIIGISVAIIWFVCVIAFAVAAADTGNSDHQFTVLTVKEDVVKDYNSMPVFKDLAEDAGVEVHWTYRTSAQYSQTIDPVAIKGIDAIYHSGFSNLKLYDYGRRGRIVAIDEYLKDEEVMPNFYKILNERPDIREALTSPDGHIYSLPRVEEMGLKAYPNILYLNKVWVERLIDENALPAGVNLTKEDLKDGLDLSRKEFKAILEKFNEKDYAGGGKTVPLAFVSGNWQGNESDFIASFGVPENREHKTVINGKIVFTIEQEEWFEAVQELADWYQRGLIRSSAFTQTDNEFLARGQDGRYGAFYWWEKDTVLAKDKRDDYIIVLPLKDDDGNRYVGVSNELEVEKGECVILSSCEDKEGLLGYFDKFFEPEYSAQLNYGSIKSGAFLSGKVNGKLIPNDDHGAQSADDFRMKNAPYGVVYLTDEVWENSVEMESRAKLRKENLTNYVIPYTYEGASSIPNLNYTQDELNDLNTYEISLSNNISSWFTKAITSGASRDSWQNLLSVNRTSINTVLQLNQMAYDRYLEAIKTDK